MNLTSAQAIAISKPCFEAEETQNPIFKTFPIGINRDLSRILTVNIGLE